LSLATTHPTTIAPRQGARHERADALRAAWLFCKHNGMEPTAKQLADTVLDVETAMHQVADALTPNAKLDGRG
jgi:hypothetical protein